MTVNSKLQQIFHSLQSVVDEHHHLSDTGVLIKRPDESLKAVVENAIPNQQGRTMEDVVHDLETVLSYRFSTGHPRFFGFIPSPASPISWLGDAITSASNPYAGSSESGAGVHAIEVAMIDWLARVFALPPTAGGQFVSGASMANLTALAVARDQRLGRGMLSQGIAYISEEAHFCITKALRILGLAEEQIRVVRYNERNEMDPNHLRELLSQDRALHYQPFAVVATSGTTSTGAMDPIDEIAEIAHEQSLWLHVDAAYGGSVAFCNAHRRRLGDIGRADSLSWDPHKWLFQTLGCGVVLFRERHQPLRSFAASAHFLRDVEDETSHNPWNYGIELTRPARHMKLWFSLHVLGLQEIDRMVTHGLNIAELVERELRTLADWEILTPASMAIINFRFHPKGPFAPKEIDMINTQVSKQVCKENKAVVLTSQVNGMVALRMCTINPRTTCEDVKCVMTSLDTSAREVTRQIVLESGKNNARVTSNDTT